jgi:hypothetical protein
MTFLHFGLLSLAGLAAIPLILHLLTLYRLKTVELSTFRFLFDSYVQQRRKIKFLEVILAILRSSFLLFMVLVVTRPVMTKWLALFGALPGGDCIMLVDCSASMNARMAGRSAIDRARSTALSVAERLPRDARLTLVRVTSHADIVFSRFTADSEDIRHKIEALSTSPSRANLFAGLSELFGSATYRQPGQTVYLFTDCQSSSWREVKEQGLAKIMPRDAKFIVVNVGSDSAMTNRAVAGEAPEESRIVVGLPVLLRPKVVNHSKTESTQVTVGVTVADREVGQVTVDLKPGESATREIIYVPRAPGAQRGRFEISSDAFPDDDTFLFTLHVVPPLKVVVINGFASPDPFQSESLFIRTALQAQSEVPRSTTALTDLAPSPDFVRSLDVQEIVESALSPAALDDASVVVLANAGSLNSQQFAWLREFVAGGGGLLIFPGDRVNHEVYSKQFFAAPAAQAGVNPARRPPPARAAGKGASAASPAEPLVDATLAAPVGDLDRVESLEKLANVSFAHPIFSVFDDPKGRYLATAQFYRRFKIMLSEDSGTTWPLAYFRNGDPAVIESRLSRGVVVLAAIPANSKWSNLPLKPEFVPLLLRMISYAMRPSEISSPSVVAAGSAAEIMVASTWAPASAKVTEPNGHASALQFERAEGQLAAAFSNTADKGFYSVEVKGSTVEQPRQAEIGFAVNLSPDESNFEMISQANLHEWLPGSEVTLVDASEQAQQSGGRIGEEKEIWRPLIALMFAIIAAEFSLSTLSSGRDTESPTVAQRIRNLGPARWVGRMTGGAEQGDQE